MELSLNQSEHIMILVFARRPICGNSHMLRLLDFESLEGFVTYPTNSQQRLARDQRTRNTPEVALFCFNLVK